MTDELKRLREIPDLALPDLRLDDSDRLVEQLLAEHSERIDAGRSGRRGPAPRRPWRVAALAFASVVLIGGVAVAAPGIADGVRQWFDHGAAEETSFNDARADDGLKTFERAQLERMFDGAPEVVSGDHGPILSEMSPMDEGRVLFDGDAGRMAALASTRGDVCYVLSRNNAGIMSTCVGDLPPSGVAFNITRDGDRLLLSALVASDVESVGIATSDGGSDSIELGDNGFVWAVTDDAPAQPVGLDVVRDGKSYAVPISTAGL